jgi:hypothetical protein
LMAGAVVSSNKIIASLVYLALLCGTDAGWNTSGQLAWS